jgi:hypothetical protein
MRSRLSIAASLTLLASVVAPGVGCGPTPAATPPGAMTEPVPTARPTIAPEPPPPPPATEPDPDPPQPKASYFNCIPQHIRSNVLSCGISERVPAWLEVAAAAAQFDELAPKRARSTPPQPAGKKGSRKRRELYPEEIDVIGAAHHYLCMVKPGDSGDHHHAEAQLAMGRAYLAANHLEEAVVILSKVAERDPNVYDTAVYAGQLMLEALNALATGEPKSPACADMIRMETPILTMSLCKSPIPAGRAKQCKELLRAADEAQKAVPPP